MRVPGRKHTAHLPIAPLPAPPRVRLPLGDMQPLVQPGDRVRAGDLVARSVPGAARQLRAYSPFSGIVAGVGADIVVAGEPDAVRPLQAYGSVVDTVREAGIVGMGGAMFPTYLKLARNPGVPSLDTIVVNALESEPYVTCDRRVLAEHRAEVDAGAGLVAATVGATRVVMAADDAGYPGGDERILVRRALARELRRRGRPPEVGVVVLNVQTIRAIARAVNERRPPVERVLTVGGGAVGRPGNYVVPMGTEVGHVLDVCEVDRTRTAVVFRGGPMMGTAATPDTTIVAGTIAVLALTRDELSVRRDNPCIRCGRCLDACPFELPVGQLVRRPTVAVLDCVECGLCEFVCPAERRLVARMRSLKRDMLARAVAGQA